MVNDMELTELTVSLLYLALPGIVAYFIARKLTGLTSDNALHQVLAIFLLSVLAYAFVALLDCLANFAINRSFTTDLVNIVLGQSRSIRLDQLIRAVGGGVLVAYILSYGHRFNVVNLVGQTLRATKRYGDEDVWHYFHNAPEKEKNEGWFFIRDYKTNLAYHCSVPTWSDTDRDREMILSNVTVFTNDTGQYLYKCALMYLCRNKDDITIEVPIEHPERFPEYQWEDPDKKTKGEHENDKAQTNK